MISVNNTLRKVSANEKALQKGFITLTKLADEKYKQVENEIEMVNRINEQIKIMQRGIEVSQHSFEILIDALAHAEQSILQPQITTTEKIKSIVGKLKLPSGLDYPSFPFSEFQKIVTPHAYSYKSFLVYVLDIHLTPTLFHLNEMKPFPVLETSTKLYSFVNPNKEIIFSDP